MKKIEDALETGIKVSSQTLIPPKNVYLSFERFTDTWSPKILEAFNGQDFKLVKLEGDKSPWHSHENEDELFFMLDGEIDILFRKHSVNLKNGDVFVVPKGQEHKVFPHRLSYCILIEPAEIKHTGNVKAEITKEKYDRL